MKRAYSLSLGVLFFGTFLATAPAQTTFFFSGIGTGWQGQVTPPNDGTANFYLGKTINQAVTLPGTFSLNTILLALGTSNDTYLIKAAVPLTLTINSGLASTGTGYGRLEFDPSINITGASALAFDAGSSTIVIPGQITGGISLGLNSSSAANSGAFVFNNTGAGNTYTGGTTISGVAGSTVVAAFWNSSPFGTGAVNVFSSAQFVAHTTSNFSNNITLSTVTANDPVYFRSWDVPLTLSGTIALGNSTFLISQVSPHGVPSADNSGIWTTPGPGSRNPIVFTGVISGASSLTVGGAGITELSPIAGPNTYSGGTTVNGSLVFGNSFGIPAPAGNVLVNNGGYVGLGGAVAGDFAAQLGHINLASTGALGVDTLPGASTIFYNAPIDLSTFTSPSIRIGTATSAILQGTLTPQNLASYQFGNGGGTLYVQSNLPNVSTVTNLQLTDANNTGSVSPLKLYLQGTNTYSGGTIANNGFIIFDGASAIPSSGLLTVMSGGYVGYTEQVTSMTPATFLSLFTPASASPGGIIGFDTYVHTILTPPSAIISGNINLSSFSNGLYLGTASAATLTGTLTPTADNILRLTAANGGTLTVNSTITGATALSLGTTLATEAYSNGYVILKGPNTYSGGTTINSVGTGITVTVDNAGALGTGALTLPQDVTGALEATAPLTLSNPVVFQTPAATHLPASLYLTGTNQIELAGAISGPGSLNLIAPLTLTGNNSGLTGDINILANTQLTLNNNNAAGTGTLRFNKYSTAVYIGAGINPTLYGIDGNASQAIQLNTGTVLTFDLSNLNNDTTFGGSIGNGVLVNASLVVTASAGGEGLYLSGNNSYTGGTTVTNYGFLALGNNNALGSGMVTLNAPNGAVALNDGITFTNPLTFTTGALMGFGTFAPAGSTSITIGANQAVIPGLYQLTTGKQDLPGNLTFATNAVFATGGQYFWSLQDVSRVDGSSQLHITGNLDLTTISTGGFTIDILTFDATNHLGLANLVNGTPYSFTILTTTGTLTGFNAANFAFNTSKFQNGLTSFSSLGLTADANHLYLNFTAVPEPSTWMLLATGTGMLGLAALRRRRT